MISLKAFACAAATSFAAFVAAVPAQAVEIEYWQYIFDVRITAMDVLFDNFQKANPDITVKQNTFPYADYRTKVAAAIPAGEGPDVVQLYYGWLNDYVQADLIQPLPAANFPADRIEAEFFPTVRAMKIDGNYLALPTAVRSLALFSNKRMFKDAGLTAPPATLDEMVEMAAKMTTRDGAGNITVEGLTSGMTAQDHHWWREVILRQFGGVPYSDDNKTVAYNTAAGVAALQFYADLEAKYGVTKSTFMDEPQAAFKAGRAGMHIDGSFRIGALKDTRGLDWGVVELPAGPDGTKSNYASYWVNAITTKAQGEKYDASVKFMEYITSDAAMTDANLVDPVFGPIVAGLGYAQTTVFADESGQRQVMVDAVSRMTLEGQSASDSLAAAAAAEQTILDGYYK